MLDTNKPMTVESDLEVDSVDAVIEYKEKVLIEEGLYKTKLHKSYPSDEPFPNKICVEHRIAEGKHLGVILKQYYGIKRHPKTNQITAPAGGFYAQDMLRLLKGKPGFRKDRVSAKQLRGYTLEVVVKTVKKNRKKESTDEEIHYSKVDSIVRIIDEKNSSF